MQSFPCLFHECLSRLSGENDNLGNVILSSLTILYIFDCISKLSQQLMSILPHDQCIIAMKLNKVEAVSKCGSIFSRFANSFVYAALSITMTYLPGNRYVIFLFYAIAELVAALLHVFVLRV